ncbi:MAG: hypothetical protein LUF30_00400 [Lachnospiraceae bacterium]|nr:hypothetical protein [Lachnospiraceae bacterium]
MERIEVASVVRIAICGDNDISNNCIVRLVREFSFLMSVIIFKKPEALLFALEDGQCFDTVIMNETFSNSNVSGIIAAERMYDQLPQAKIILIVDYSKKLFRNCFCMI